jgi:hypothetical protein
MEAGNVRVENTGDAATIVVDEEEEVSVVSITGLGRGGILSESRTFLEDIAGVCGEVASSLRF